MLTRVLLGLEGEVHGFERLGDLCVKFTRPIKIDKLQTWTWMGSIHVVDKMPIDAC